MAGDAAAAFRRQAQGLLDERAVADAPGQHPGRTPVVLPGQLRRDAVAEVHGAQQHGRPGGEAQGDDDAAGRRRVVVEPPAHRGAVKDRRVPALQGKSVDARREPADHGVHKQADHGGAARRTQAQAHGTPVPGRRVAQHLDDRRREADLRGGADDRRTHPQLREVRVLEGAAQLFLQELTGPVVDAVDRLPAPDARLVDAVVDARETRMLGVERHRGAHGHEDDEAHAGQGHRQPQADAAAHHLEGDHEEAGDQPYRDHGGHLLEARGHQQEIGGGAHEDHAGGGARQSQRHARHAVKGTLAEQDRAQQAQAGPDQRPRQDIAGAREERGDRHGPHQPPQQGPHGEVPRPQAPEQQLVGGDDHGGGEQHEAEPVEVADHDPGLAPGALRVGGAVHAPDHRHDQKRDPEDRGRDRHGDAKAAQAEQPALDSQRDGNAQHDRGEGHERQYQASAVDHHQAAQDIEVHDVLAVQVPEVEVTEPPRQSKGGVALVLQADRAEVGQRIVGGVVVPRSVEGAEAHSRHSGRDKRPEIALDRQATHDLVHQRGGVGVRRGGRELAHQQAVARARLVHEHRRRRTWAVETQHHAHPISPGVLAQKGAHPEQAALLSVGEQEDDVVARPRPRRQRAGRLEQRHDAAAVVGRSGGRGHRVVVGHEQDRA